MHGDVRNLMAHPLYYDQLYGALRNLFRELVPDHQIKLVVNEWNTALPVPLQHSMESALYGARLMNVFERNGDLVALSSVSDLVNGWSGGVIQASRHGLFVTPTYLVNKLYNEHLGTERLAARVESPTFDTSVEGKGIPYLDAVVSRSGDRKHVFVKAVNTDLDRPLSVTIRLYGVAVEPTALLETITAGSLTAANSFENPDAVSIRSSSIKAGPSFSLELPKHSVSVITLDVLD